jgi:hypothetical protein
MKRVVSLLMLGCLAGCPSIDPTQAKKYQCSDPQRSALQCPGGWRCTLDGFCADPEVGQELTCQRDDDCTGQWSCALTGKCVNPQLGRPLPCDAQHACPGGWRCGVIGQCFDPDAGAALPCQSEQDCPNAWHCGAGPVCYELATATSVACRLDAGTDCAPGWRCGLEARCHLEDAGLPLLCVQDSDCEHAWRCDATGHCADATLDALRSTATTGTVVVTPVPSFVPDDVQALSISASTSPPFGPAQLAAFVGDGGLTVVAFDIRSTQSFDAGAGQPRVAGMVAHAAATGVRAVSAQQAPLVWTATSTQLIGSLFQAPDQLRQTYTLAPGFAVSRFRLLDHAVLAAFDEHHVVTLSDAGTLTPVYTSPTGSTGLITDVGILRAHVRRPDAGVGSETQVFVVLTSAGVLASPWDGTQVTGEWVPVGFGDGVQLTELAPTPSSASGVALLLEHDASGQGVVQTLSSGPLPAGGGWLEAPYAPGKALVAQGVAWSACAGDAVGLTADQPGGWWAVHCVADGGAVVHLASTSASATYAPIDVPLRDGFTFARDNSEVLAHAGRGAALVGTDTNSGGDTGFPMVPVAAGEPIDRIFGKASAPGVMTRPSQADAAQCAQGLLDYCQASVAPVLCATGNTSWLWCRPAPSTPLSRVTGQPDMALVDLRTQQTPVPFAIYRVDPTSPDDLSRGVVATSALDFGDVGATATARTFDGGLQMFVGATDHLYWGDLSAPDTAYPDGLANPSAFHFAVVPQPGATITSVAGLEGAGAPDGGTHFAEGYLVASGRVHHFTADNAVVWVSDLEAITTAEAVAVWADGRRGRVAFRDGSVFGLPSRVPLSEPVSPGASTVLALESMCGQTFALTTLGLFQLRTSSAPLATWERIDLGLPDSALRGGQLVAEEAGLFLALPGNASRRLTGFTCAQ